MKEQEEFEFRLRLEKERAEPVAKPKTSVMQDIGGALGKVGKFRNELVRDAVGGFVSGAGSIGATIAAPYDMAKDAVNGKGLSLDSNRERRADIGGALQSMGVDTGSNTFGLMNLGAQIAGTGGVGGALAKGAQAAGAAPAFVNSLASAGMSTGANVGKGALPYLANMGTRMAGGAATGAASVLAVTGDPSDAVKGAAIGGFLPPVMAGVGAGANALGRLISGPGVSQAVTDGAKTARQAGLVIPPTQVKPTLGNRLMEGSAGKLTTAQNASAKNSEILNDIVGKDFGLAKGTQITPEILSNIRKQAGQAYAAVSSTGTITPGPAYTQALDDITAAARKSAAGFPNDAANPLIAKIDALKSPKFDAGSAVSKISDLRNAADVAYRSGDKALGKGLKSAAEALENTIEAHLVKTGDPADLLKGYREARQLIAKTYSAEKALNPTTGTINSLKLAAQLDKGKPLSGGLRTAGEFAQQFPKAAQPLEKMGSLPQFSPLDLFATAGLGGVSGISGDPRWMALAAVRPGMRALALSPMVQNKLANTAQPNRLASLMSNQEANQLLYRASPQAANR